MIGKKDNCDIFNQYSRIILEQSEDSIITSLISKIKTSSIDNNTKNDILDLLNDEGVQNIYKTMVSKKQSGFVDQDTANEPDPKFASELNKARQDQEQQYPANEKTPTRFGF